MKMKIFLIVVPKIQEIATFWNIEASDAIVKLIAANINSINVNLANTINKEKPKGLSIQKSSDATEKVASSQSDHQIKGKTDYRTVIVRCKDGRKVFMNPSKNLND